MNNIDKIRHLQQDIIDITKRAEKAEALAGKYRMVLEKVEKWMAQESGPLHFLWEDGLIGQYESEDGGDIDWPLTLERIRNPKWQVSELGTCYLDNEIPVILLYREILAALIEGRGAVEETI